MSKNKLKPSTAKQLRQYDSSYQSCRKKILGELERKKLSLESAKDRYRACNTKFPSSALYLSCKKDLVRKVAKSKPAQLKAGLKQCRELQLASAYQRDSAIQFARVKQHIFFAGMDLDQKTTASSLNELENFDCSPLLSAFKDFSQAEYLLFGNKLKQFKNIASAPPKRLSQLARRSPQGEKDSYIEIEGLGRVYSMSQEDKLIFFPSSHCQMNQEPSSIFKDHKLYYLMDSASEEAWPYFGISFFADSSKINLKILVAQLTQTLGPGYRAQKLKDGAVLISQEPVLEFDGEGDPKNLCEVPRKHQFIGLIKTSDQRPYPPELLLVANINNLCAFGDQLAIGSPMK